MSLEHFRWWDILPLRSQAKFRLYGALALLKQEKVVAFLLPWVLVEKGVEVISASAKAKYSNLWPSSLSLEP